jgi:hypothetical protein
MTWRMVKCTSKIRPPARGHHAVARGVSDVLPQRSRRESVPTQGASSTPPPSCAMPWFEPWSVRAVMASAHRLAATACSVAPHNAASLTCCPPGPRPRNASRARLPSAVPVSGPAGGRTGRAAGPCRGPSASTPLRPSPVLRRERGPPARPPAGHAPAASADRTSVQKRPSCSRVS